MQNKEIASKFKLLGKLTELHEGNAFKARSYANAAFQIGRLDDQLADMAPADINRLQGVGKAISSKIQELLTTGKMDKLEGFLAATPPGLMELLSIKGLGGKKLATIWKELGVESPGELLYACYENRLALLKGFGQKTQDSVIQAIEFYNSNRGNFLFAKIEAFALTTLQELKTAAPEAQIDFTGAFLRRDPILESIDYIIADDRANGDMDFSSILADSLPLDWYTAETGASLPIKAYQAKAENGLTLTVNICLPEQFELAQVFTSSLPDHRNALDFNKASEAAELYKNAGLEIAVPAELRDRQIDFVAGDHLNHLINQEAIKGVVHSHSRWSDGTHSLEQMATATKEKGFEYLVISDHSKSAVYASGLEVERVMAQHKEINDLNARLAPFHIFKSIESDILGDGSLDYPDEVLETFDLVIASVHTGLKMDEAKATQRLIKAIENPYTTILGHPSGRLLLAREGYPIDYTKLIDACAANGVVLELNANPNRLDIDYRWIREATDKGVMISINPDAHSIDGIDDIRYGTYAARKGGLLVEQCWNAMPLNELKGWLEKASATRSNSMA